MKSSKVLKWFLISAVMVELAVVMNPNPLSALLQRKGESASLEAYAKEVVEKCQNSRSRATCYDTEIPKLMDYISFEDAFRVTSLVQEEDSSYRYCHVLGHELSAREVRKNPDDWQNIVTRCPSGLCSNGCLHGGFQERFRKESATPQEVEALIPTLQNVCESRGNWSPTGLEKGSCYHALGHLAMYLTNADISSALSICDRIAYERPGSNYLPICYDGAFMQIFQPLEPEDFALIKGKEVSKEAAPSFCAGYEGVQKTSCWSEAWPLFLEELKKPAGLTAHCNTLPHESRGKCYTALIYVLTVQMGFKAETMETYCAGLEPDRRGKCFADVATRFIETDHRNIKDSVDICLAAEPFDPEHACFKDLVFYATYNFHVGSDAYFALCHAMPNPWQSECLAKQKG